MIPAFLVLNCLKEKHKISPNYYDKYDIVIMSWHILPHLFKTFVSTCDYKVHVSIPHLLYKVFLAVFLEMETKIRKEKKETPR